ncbi:MAG TPA: hypothetical protein VK082_06780 [Paenalcaligenes sp.]|nr:hypothetical protein [Paenalcaligenes sp.]
MSWRLIFVVLLSVLGASAWGGYLLGNWLIENGPMRVPTVASFEDFSPQTTLGADGKPFTAQPPQPLVDGRLGIPEDPDTLSWQIDNSHDLFAEAPPISLATTTISMSEAIRITGRDQHDSGLQGIAQLDRVQPVEAGDPPPPPSQDVVETDPSPQQGGSWQADLQRELEACKQLGFFKRPSCAWEARNKYCAPNNAWGQVSECPKKDF